MPRLDGTRRTPFGARAASSFAHRSLPHPSLRHLLHLAWIAFIGATLSGTATANDTAPADTSSAAAAAAIAAASDPAASDPAAADSSGAPADTTTARLYYVRLDNGEELQAARVRRTSRENLLVMLLTGEKRLVPVYDVVSIEDDKGDDLTRDVMEGWTTVTAKPDSSWPASSKLKRPSHFLHGYPLPERSSYVVMELGYMVPLDRSKQGNTMSGYGVWQLAYLKNVNETYAIGPAIQAEYGGSEGRFSAMIRGRRWLSRTTSLEMGLGASVGTRASALESVRSTEPTIFLQGSVNVDDALMLMLQAETFKRDYPSWYDSYPGSNRIGDTESGIQVLAGGRLGGALGVAAAGIGGVLYLGLIALIIASGAAS